MVGLLVLSIGLGAVVTSSEPNTEITTKNLVFSTPTIINENQNYVTVTVNEANSYLMKEGKPMLPSYTQVFNFPMGTQIISVTCTKSNIQTQALDKKIMPTPQKTTAGTNIPVTQIIVSADSYPETYYEYDVGCGITQNLERSIIVTVKAYPVKYYPSQGKIEYAKNMQIKVTYTPPSNPVYTEEGYKLIILTPDEFSDKLNTLVDHKNNDMGVTTKKVTLSQIYGGTYFPVQGRDDQEKIKYFIKNAIENWGTSYVLLIGAWYDTSPTYQKFPVRKTHVYMDDSDNNEFVSDLYYADIYDGAGVFCSWDSNGNGIFGEFYDKQPSKNDKVDLHPDVYLGRIPCNNGNQLTTVVNKIIAYETGEAYTKNWFTDLIVVGGDSFIDSENDPDGLLEGELVNEVVMSIMDNFIPDRIQVSNNKLTLKTQLNTALDGGAGFVDFSGHGNTNIWATHPHLNSNTWLPGGGYFSADVGGLSNQEKLPIVVTGACSVSKFNKDTNCFSWSWLANNNGGAIATFGATALGYAYIAEYVTYGLVEKIAIGTFSAYANGAVATGEMWAGTINSYMVDPGMGSDGDYKTIEEWQLFGDPSLKIAEDSQAPLKPNPPDGTASGAAGTEYTYYASTTDPDGGGISYIFDWGDGSYSGWVGPYDSGATAEAKHTWSSQGSYDIRVKAKDVHGAQSDWSDSLPVKMPVNYQSSQSQQQSTPQSNPSAQQSATTPASTPTATTTTTATSTATTSKSSLLARR